ncbi:hypothetical protein ACFX2J_046813 [Malus domestica]
MFSFFFFLSSCFFFVLPVKLSPDSQLLSIPPKSSPLIPFFFFVPGISPICHSKAEDVDVGFSTVTMTVQRRRLDVFLLKGWVHQTFSKFPHGRRRGEKFVGRG